MRRLEPRISTSSERDRRRRFVVGAVVVVVVILTAAFGAKLALMQVAASRGLDAMARGDYLDAERSFRVNLVANWFDPWRAHFNVGVALFEQGRWPQAQEQFSTALAHAPESRRCIVALNLAWSYEAEGDQAAELGDFAGASEAWRMAEAVAEHAGCGEGSGGDADSDQSLEEQQAETAERAADKADDAEASAAEQQGGAGDTDRGQPSAEDRLGELEASNQQSQQHRQGTSFDADVQPGTGDSEHQVPTW